jgi:putative ABC transport system substrate-binding protein
MKRREFLAALLAAQGAWGESRPLEMKRLGLFFRGQGSEDLAKGFGKRPLGVALASRGWVEGRTLEVVARDAGVGRPGHLSIARQLVDQRPDVLFTNTWFLARALQAATTTIPIVASVGDPVGTGLAKSIAVPGGNVTGFSLAFDLVVHKQIELLRQALPRLTTLYSFRDSVNAEIEAFRTNSAREAGLALKFWESLPQFDADMDKMKPNDRAALLAGIWLRDYKSGGEAWKDVARVALRHRLPSASVGRGYVASGGLLSFSMTHQGNMDERIAQKIDRVLRGANPATMPFELPERSSFGFNRATAAAIGLKIPQAWLLRADYIVEGPAAS